MRCIVKGARGLQSRVSTTLGNLPGKFTEQSISDLDLNSNPVLALSEGTGLRLGVLTYSRRNQDSIAENHKALVWESVRGWLSDFHVYLGKWAIFEFSTSNMVVSFSCFGQSVAGDDRAVSLTGSAEAKGS
ncbi:hypothetical protein H2248_010427 [Termitomyces sp. 'cryptogamus']|nr:hypothetical protein H2248_010427 [Termitomyces sp. 'cryptogamus']